MPEREASSQFTTSDTKSWNIRAGDSISLLLAAPRRLYIASRHPPRDMKPAGGASFTASYEITVRLAVRSADPLRI
jgi:hypothetical protein